MHLRIAVADDAAAIAAKPAAAQKTGGTRIQLASVRSERGQAATSRAEVTESPLANSVTSWPIATSSSVRNETTRSVPPYNRGGTDSVSGAIWATRIFVKASKA